MEEELGPQAEALIARRKSRKRPVRIRLPEPERCGRHTIILKDVRKTWPIEGGREHVVYEGLNFQAERGEHIALVGPNGAGKSTLLKVLAASTGFQSGERVLGHNVTTYHYGQHQADELHPSHTVLEEVRTVMRGAGETQVRGLLGAFLFSEDEVDKRIEVLSGGEKARVALAKMLARPANVLLLDEPTNHLDLESREVLERALAEYSGSIIFVSHDRYFINRVANKVIEVQAGQQPMSYPGDYDYWVWKKREAQAPPKQKTGKAKGKGKGKGKGGGDRPKGKGGGDRSKGKGGGDRSKGNAGGDESKGKRSVGAKPHLNPSDKKQQAAPSASKAAGPKSANPAPAAAKPASSTPPMSKNSRQKAEREVETLEGEISEIEQRIMEIDGELASPEVYASPDRFNDLLAERNKLEPRLQRRMQRWEELSSRL
jgi:ATP-binding cassette subfamily F protein 3